MWHVAQHDVDQDWPDARVDASDRLHPRQHGVGHSLWDVHDGHGQSGHQVTQHVLPPPVGGQPGEDGHQGEEVAAHIVTGD